MPGPKKKPIISKVYTEGYATEGQRITTDGAEVIMKNGARFKRVVLPSVAEGGLRQVKEEMQLDEAFAEVEDQMRTQEKGIE
jgi:hypothetical protein